MTATAREWLQALAEELQALDQRIAAIDQQIERLLAADKACQRLAQLAGIGPLVPHRSRWQPWAMRPTSRMKKKPQFAAWFGPRPPGNIRRVGRQRILG